jgi:hypothetical protein
VSNNGTTSVSTATNGSRLVNKQKAQSRRQRAFSGNAKRIPLETDHKTKLPEIKYPEKPKFVRKPDYSLKLKGAAKFGEPKKYIGSFTESQKESNNGKASISENLGSCTSKKTITSESKSKLQHSTTSSISKESQSKLGINEYQLPKDLESDSAAISNKEEANLMCTEVNSKNTKNLEKTSTSVAQIQNQQKLLPKKELQITKIQKEEKKKYTMVNKSITEIEKGLKIKSKKHEKQYNAQGVAAVKTEESEHMCQPTIDENRIEISVKDESKNIAMNPSGSTATIIQTPILSKANQLAAKEYGLSFDSKKINASIGLMDIDHLCKCMALAILKHIEFSQGELLVDDLVQADDEIPQF